MVNFVWSPATLAPTRLAPVVRGATRRSLLRVARPAPIADGFDDSAEDAEDALTALTALPALPAPPALPVRTAVLT